MNCKGSLFVLVITALLLSPIQTIGAKGSPNQIEGTWEVRVNLHDPNLPPFFEALETYDRDGGFLTSNNMPFLTRVGQGSWEKVGQTYNVKIKFFKFDVNGLPSGTITVTHRVNLQGDEYSGRGTAIFRELDGSETSVEFDSQGRRLSEEQ